MMLVFVLVSFYAAVNAFVLHPSFRSQPSFSSSSTATISTSLSPSSLQSSISPLKDPYESYTLFEKLLFHRFAASVASEIDLQTSPSNYSQLISTIQSLTHTSASFQEVNNASKNMLTSLFPSWLLPQFKILFASPFPQFSAWMNTWVTHLTTSWLMGKSTVVNLIVSVDEESKSLLQDEEKKDQKAPFKVYRQQELVIEKCLFLETSGCLQTCIHACKIPTQRFFSEDMGLPVTLLPNVTDYSCRFQFGVKPVPIEEDPIMLSPCLAKCTMKNVSGKRKMRLDGTKKVVPSCRLD